MYFNFRYFKNGVCREGNNCRYRHSQSNRHDMNSNEAETASGGSTSNVPCRFFKHGICKFGNQCHFRHNSDNADNNVICNNAIENSSSGQRAKHVSKTK